MRLIKKSLSVLSAGVCFLASAFALANPQIESFEDKGLAVALQATLRHHPALMGKRAELEAKGYAADSARAGRYPSLSAQAGFDENNESSSTLMLQQPLWAFGKINIPIEFADADIVAENLSLLKIQRELIENTAITYARIEDARLRVEVADADVAELERLYLRVQRREQGQLASEVDVKLAYSRQIQSRAQRETIRGERQILLSELQALTQIVVNTEQPIDPLLSQLPPLAEVEADTITHSAEVQYKTQLVKLAKLDHQRVKASAYPTLVLRIEHDIAGASNYIDNTRAGVFLEAKFDGLGFASIGKANQARSLTVAALQGVRVTENEIKRQVKNLMTNRRVQATIVAAQKASVAALSDTMDSYLRQYESERKSWLEVLNIQRELTGQRLQLAQAQSQWLQVSLRLAAMSGRLDSLAGIGIQQ